MTDGNRQTGLRAQRTRKAIKTAFENMICNQEDRGITVSKVAECAGVSRKTFYLHFTCIEDLFDDTVGEVCDGYAQALAALQTPVSNDDVNKTFFEYFAEQDLFVDRLMSQDGYREYADRILQCTVDANCKCLGVAGYLDHQEAKVMDSFVVRNQFHLYHQWIACGKQIPLDRLIELAHEHLYSGMDSII